MTIFAAFSKGSNSKMLRGKCHERSQYKTTADHQTQPVDGSKKIKRKKKIENTEKEK